jgi:5-methylcytosine-specific restriction endonuclease McrA
MDVYKSLEQCPALVLNADFRPLSYFPLSIWPWQEAVKAIFRDTVIVLSEYEKVIHSPSKEIKLPSVLVLKDYVQMERRPAFTRFNVFLRDRWDCQYCGEKFTTSELTFDHVVPKSRGGITSWDNIVTACQDCNLLKGARLPRECGMRPLHEPGSRRCTNSRNTADGFPRTFFTKAGETFSIGTRSSWTSSSQAEGGLSCLGDLWT